MSKYQIVMKRETSQNAGKGMYMVPPMPESINEMRK